MSNIFNLDGDMVGVYRTTHTNASVSLEINPVSSCLSQCSNSLTKDAFRIYKSNLLAGIQCQGDENINDLSHETRHCIHNFNQKKHGRSYR